MANAWVSNTWSWRVKLGQEWKVRGLPSCLGSRSTEGREGWKNGLLLVLQMASISHRYFIDCNDLSTNITGDIWGRSRNTPNGSVFFFNWCIIDLQCYVNFCCTAKWFSYMYIYVLLLNILFHCGLSQDIEYRSLCCTVGPCCLPILYILISIC